MKNVIVVDVASLHLCLRITVMLLFPFVLLAQWEPDVRLTNNNSASFLSWNNAWCVASSGSNVHVAWYDFRDGNSEIYYKRSLDNGSNWSEDTRLTYHNVNAVGYPSIAVSDSFIHIVWMDGRDGNSEIYYKRSLDNGTSWSEDTRLTNNPAYSWLASIAVYGSGVHIVWRDTRDGNDEIYYKHSLDNGTTWSEDVRLTNNSAESWFPSVAVFGSIVHVVWEDSRDGNTEIYYKHSLDNGTNWTPDIKLTNNSVYAWHPSVAVSGSNVHLAWYDYRNGNPEIYYKRSLDNGVNWETEIRHTENIGESVDPSIAVSGSYVHLVWFDDCCNDNEEIYYKCSFNNGTSWSQNIRLTNDSAVSHSSSVAVSGSYVHVVWQDTRDGNDEIYYKRNPTGNGTGNEIEENRLTVDAKCSMIEVYPNPASSYFAVRLPLTADRIKIFDVSGKFVKEILRPTQNDNTVRVSLDGIKNGVYFVQVGNEILKQKLIVTR